MKKNKYFTYNQAKKYVTSLNLEVKSLRDLVLYLRDNPDKYSKKLPKVPHQFYAEKRHGGWVSFTDFTGIKNRRHVAKYKIDEKSIKERKAKILETKNENNEKYFNVIQEILAKNDHTLGYKVLYAFKADVITSTQNWFAKQEWSRYKDTQNLNGFYDDCVTDVMVAIFQVKFTPEIIKCNARNWIRNSLKREIRFAIIRELKIKMYNHSAPFSSDILENENENEDEYEDEYESY
jgi:hypothetical protein